MSYLKIDEFATIATECKFDPKSILDYLHANGHPEYPLQGVNNRLGTLRRKGVIPLDSGNFVSAGEVLKATSTLFDEDGKVKLQWIKSDIPKEQQLEAFKAAIDAITDSVTPRPSVPSPSDNLEDLMSVYTIGDAHIGMLAWGPESGEDNDLVTAETNLVAAMSMLVEQSNPTKEAFIIDVGDYFHSDNSENKTAKSGNVLDVDGRYAKVLEIGLRLTTELINKALEKHEVVRWRSAIGNHNEHSALMMNQFIKAYYRLEPRVIVHDSPSMFMYHQFGKNLLGVTHGHTAKPQSLGEIMSVDCEDIWSSTKYRYWYTGHIHHQSVKEYPSCVVETFRTLAGKDAWHAGMGYRSGQDMKCITLHKNFGEVSRNTVNITMLSDPTP